MATGLGVEMPKALDSEHERMREKLQTLHGRAFDEQQEERSGHNGELKQLAQKNLTDARETPENGSRAVAQARPDRSQIVLAVPVVRDSK